MKATKVEKLAPEEAKQILEDWNKHQGHDEYRDFCQKWGMSQKQMTKFLTNKQEQKEEECVDCGTNEEDHPCPYQEEIHGNHEDYCTCCPFHIKQCKDSI